jgi:hypothetical protein
MRSSSNCLPVSRKGPDVRLKVTHRPLSADEKVPSDTRRRERRMAYAESLVFNIEIGWKAISIVVILASYVILNLVETLRGLASPGWFNF